MDTQDTEEDIEIVARAWVSQGWRIESQLPGQIVLVSGHRVNHVLHLILSIITLGLWSIVWLILAIGGGEKRRIVTADRNGEAVVRKI